MSDSPVGIVVKATDHATEAINNVHKSVSHLDQALGTIRGKFTTGFITHAGQQALNLFEEGVRKVADAIPDLIHRGEDWATTIEHITSVSGLSAETASMLAAAQAQLAGSSDGLDTIMAQLAKHVATGGPAFDDLGVSLKGVHDGTVSMDQIFMQVRDRLASMTDASRRAADAAAIFGRSWRSAAILLTESKIALQQQMQTARESGVVLTEEGIRAARAFELSQHSIGEAITGISSQVFQGAAPALTALTNAVSGYVRAHLTEIVNFVVQVVGVVSGFVSGLLGVELSITSLGTASDAGASRLSALQDRLAKLTGGAKAAAAALPQVTAAIQAQINAIGREIAALDRQNQAEQARQQYQQALKDIATAKNDLAQVRLNTIDTIGMSDAAAQLAMQAHAKAVTDAEKKVADAEKKAQQQRHQNAVSAERNRLQAQQQALQAQLARAQQASTAMGGINQKAIAQTESAIKRQEMLQAKAAGHTAKALSTTMSTVLQAAIQQGKQFADDIQTAVFGPSAIIANPAWMGGSSAGARSGGLVGALQGLQKDVQNLGSFFRPLTDALGSNGGLALDVVALIAAIKLIPGAGAAGGAIGDVGAGILGGGSGLAAAVAPIAAAVVASLGLNAILNLFRGNNPGTVPLTHNINSGTIAHTAADVSAWLPQVLGDALANGTKALDQSFIDLGTQLGTVGSDAWNAIFPPPPTGNWRALYPPNGTTTPQMPDPFNPTGSPSPGPPPTSMIFQAGLGTTQALTVGFDSVGIGALGLGQSGVLDNDLNAISGAIGNLPDMLSGITQGQFQGLVDTVNGIDNRTGNIKVDTSAIAGIDTRTTNIKSDTGGLINSVAQVRTSLGNIGPEVHQLHTELDGWVSNRLTNINTLASHTNDDTQYMRPEVRYLYVKAGGQSTAQPKGIAASGGSGGGGLGGSDESIALLRLIASRLEHNGRSVAGWAARMSGASGGPSSSSMHRALTHT